MREIERGVEGFDGNDELKAQPEGSIYILKYRDQRESYKRRDQRVERGIRVKTNGSQLKSSQFVVSTIYLITTWSA